MPVDPVMKDNLAEFLTEKQEGFEYIEEIKDEAEKTVPKLLPVKHRWDNTYCCFCGL